MFTVLLFYKFVKLTDFRALRDAHQAYCEPHGIKGRVFLAHEGLNGTAAGTSEQMLAYQKYLRAIPEFSDLEFKTETVAAIPFAKMKTKVRPAIVNMGLTGESDVKPFEVTGRHLSPEEWKIELAAPERDFLLLDVRNKYESDIGHFEGAECPDLENFWQFPKWAQETLSAYKDKKILMYCTGGIRCEKFSSLLLREGFQDVNQLHGGILNYRDTIGGDHYKGKCFVFDDRLATSLNKNSAPIATCQLCGQPEDRYVNCANMPCNELFICCDACAVKHEATCQESCQNSAQKRPFDFASFRIPFRTKGNVFPELGRRQKKA